MRDSDAGRGDPGLVPLPGLDPTRTYTVRVRARGGAPRRGPDLAACLVGRGAPRAGSRLSGAVLAGVGLPLPVLAPAQGFLLHLT